MRRGEKKRLLREKWGKNYASILWGKEETVRAKKSKLFEEGRKNKHLTPRKFLLKMKKIGFLGGKKIYP